MASLQSIDAAPLSPRVQSNETDVGDKKNQEVIRDDPLVSLGRNESEENLLSAEVRGQLNNRVIVYQGEQEVIQNRTHGIILEASTGDDASPLSPRVQPNERDVGDNRDQEEVIHDPLVSLGKLDNDENLLPAEAQGRLNEIVIVYQRGQEAIQNTTNGNILKENNGVDQERFSPFGKPTERGGADLVDPVVIQDTNSERMESTEGITSTDADRYKDHSHTASTTFLQLPELHQLSPCCQPNEDVTQDTQKDIKEVLGHIPPVIWQFNDFLVELSDRIEADELDTLKAMFTDIIGRGVLEKFKSAKDLFDHLRKLTYLSRNNIMCLQKLLMKLNRPDLIQMAIQYATTVGDTIYFYQDSASPVSGYRKMKVHVAGKDFQSCSERFIRTLRAEFSHLLCIPYEHVLIAGVEPSLSMLIIVMIPDIYADVIEEMLKTNIGVLQQLSELEIDTVQIGDTVFNIKGTEDAELSETLQQAKLVNVYQQLQKKTKELALMEQEVFKLTEMLQEKNKAVEQVYIFHDFSKGPNIRLGSVIGHRTRPKSTPSKLFSFIE